MTEIEIEAIEASMKKSQKWMSPEDYKKMWDEWEQKKANGDTRNLSREVRIKQLMETATGLELEALTALQTLTEAEQAYNEAQNAYYLKRKRNGGVPQSEEQQVQQLHTAFVRIKNVYNAKYAGVVDALMSGYRLMPDEDIAGIADEYLSVDAAAKAKEKVRRSAMSQDDKDIEDEYLRAIADSY